MREIKLKAWDKINKIMFDNIEKISFIDNYIDARASKSGTVTRGLNMNNIELMQYTGLKDSTEKEIYEGDIIEVQSLEDMGERIDKMTGEIIYEPEAWSYLLKIKDEKYHFNPYGIFKKLGNKYENSELMEEV